MRAKPQVSCIVPAYNAEKYLKQALDSALAQSGVALELIVVDDGSTDETASIAASFGKYVQLVCQSNLGKATAYNRGLGLARGEFVAFLDADDLWRSDKLERQLAAFAENRGLELCAAHIQNFEGEMETVGDPLPGFGSEMLIRFALFDRVGPFTTGYAMPLEWMLRARESKAVELLLPDALTFRRLHDQNMSVLHANEMLRDHLHVLHASLKRRELVR